MPTNDTVVKSDEIYETIDYDKFTLIKGNRQLDSQHVNSLQKSILTNGNLTMEEPVEVNSRFEIFDGQHRFEALKRLELPVYYKFRESASIQLVRISNSSRKNWNWKDYAQSFRDDPDMPAEARHEYELFLQLHEEFNERFSILLFYLGYRNSRSRNETEFFYNGQLKVRDFGRTHELLTQYYELAEAARLGRNRDFAVACYNFMSLSTYNHPRMKDLIRVHQTALFNCYTADAYEQTLRQIWQTTS